MFSCNLPPALSAKLCGSFTCCCSNTGVEQILKYKISTASWPWRRKCSHHSCRDSNPQPFDHKSGTLTTELSPLHFFFFRCYTEICWVLLDNTRMTKHAVAFQYVPPPPPPSHTHTHQSFFTFFLTPTCEILFSLVWWWQRFWNSCIYTWRFTLNFQTCNGSWHSRNRKTTPSDFRNDYRQKEKVMEVVCLSVHLPVTLCIHEKVL